MCADINTDIKTKHGRGKPGKSNESVQIGNHEKANRT